MGGWGILNLCSSNKALLAKWWQNHRRSTLDKQGCLSKIIHLNYLDRGSLGLLFHSPTRKKYFFSVGITPILSSFRVCTLKSVKKKVLLSSSSMITGQMVELLKTCGLMYLMIALRPESQLDNSYLLPKLKGHSFMRPSQWAPSHYVVSSRILFSSRRCVYLDLREQKLFFSSILLQIPN